MLAQFLSVAPAWLLEGEADYAPQAVPLDISQIKARLKQARGTLKNLSNHVETLQPTVGSWTVSALDWISF